MGIKITDKNLVEMFRALALVQGKTESEMLAGLICGYMESESRHIDPVIAYPAIVFYCQGYERSREDGKN